METASLRARAERLRGLHDGPRLLLLPNIWDALGAQLLASLGFPAVATASAAIAWSHGVDDGQRLPFEAMVGAIGWITRAVDVPVTADLEAGYADEPEGVAANVLRAIQAGAVGVNLEDSLGEGHRFFPVARQCARLRAVRRAADEASVPIVINARTDLFLAADRTRDDARAEAIERGNAYREAGADCLYPIGATDLDVLAQLGDACRLPLNVLATPGTPPIRQLEQAGIRRLSVGPGLIKASLTAMRDAVASLREGGSYDRFTSAALSSDEVRRLLGG